MTLSEIAKIHSSENDLNCAQAVFLAVSDLYNLGYTKADTQLMAGFGGGMACAETCGALVGGVAILGKVILKDGQTNSPQLKKMTSTFVKQFKAEFSSLNCRDIAPIYRKLSPSGCVLTIGLASDILEKLLEDKDNYM